MRFELNKYLLAGVALFSVVFPSCETVVTDCTYLITPTVQRKSGGSYDWYTHRDSVVIYGFVADIAFWKVANYEDAKIGRITNKLNPGETRDWDFEATTRGDMYFEIGPFKSDPIMLVACDLKDHKEERIVEGEEYPAQFYAWRNVNVPDNLPQVMASLVFRAYSMDAKDVVLAKWTVRNDGPLPLPSEEEEQEECTCGECTCGEECECQAGVEGDCPCKNECICGDSCTCGQQECACKSSEGEECTCGEGCACEEPAPTEPTGRSRFR